MSRPDAIAISFSFLSNTPCIIWKQARSSSETGVVHLSYGNNAGLLCVSSVSPDLEHRNCRTTSADPHEVLNDQRGIHA